MARRSESANIFKTISAVAVAAETTVWTPATGTKFVIMGYALSSTTAISISLKDNTGGTTFHIVPTLLVGTPFYVQLGEDGYVSTTINNVLTMTGSAAGSITGTIWGRETTGL